MKYYIPNQHKSSYTNRKRFFMEYCKHTLKHWFKENGVETFEQKINNPIQLLYAQEFVKETIGDYKITGSLN